MDVYDLLDVWSPFFCSNEDGRILRQILFLNDLSSFIVVSDHKVTFEIGDDFISISRMSQSVNVAANKSWLKG